MKILITGANGQLGSEIRLLSDRYSWDFNFTDIEELNLINPHEVDAYITELKPDYVINCAAFTAVDKAETETSGAELLNARVPENLSMLAKKLKFNLIHISTDYVFSGKTFIPWKESDETHPETVYGSTKLLGELLVLKNCDAIIIRTSWLYSIFGNNFVKTMIKLGKERDSLGVVFDQTGTPTNAADLAQAILDIVQYTEENKSWKSGIYHYSNEGVTSWYDFAMAIMEIANITCTVKPIESKDYPVPTPRPNYSVLNKTKIKKAFNITVPHWRNSLQTVVEKLK